MPASPPTARSTGRPRPRARAGAGAGRGGRRAHLVVRARRWSSAAAGRVLNVASTAGMQPIPYSAGYSAAKAYVLTFSEALHHELRGSGITVTALCPGPVSTDFWQISGWEVTGGQIVRESGPSPGVGRPRSRPRGPVSAGLAAGRRVVVPQRCRPQGDARRPLHPERTQAARDRAADAPSMSEPKDASPPLAAAADRRYQPRCQ